jgi:hypothetical protein
MNPIEILKREHRQIEMEIFQIETVMEEGIINYSNLLHSFRKLVRTLEQAREKRRKNFRNNEERKYYSTSAHNDLRT